MFRKVHYHVIVAVQARKRKGRKEAEEKKQGKKN